MKTKQPFMNRQGGIMERAKVFLLGVLTAIALMFLLGAGSPVNPQYQIHGVVGSKRTFIVDTQTGVTKIVDKDDFGKPFDQITTGVP